jgi:hypothetical protein
MRDLERVIELLAEGADPGIPSVEYDWRLSLLHPIIYNDDGTYCRANMSAICTLVFCLSDCLLTDKDYDILVQILEIFIARGVDTTSALQLFHDRYGVHVHDHAHAHENHYFIKVHSLLQNDFMHDNNGECEP